MRSFPALAELLAEPKLAALILDPAPALVFDPDGNLRFANRSALSAYGAATLSELIEKSESLFGEMPDAAREFAETLPLNGLYRREAIALANDTETFRCERIGFANGVEAVLFTGLARERFDGNVGQSFGVLFDGERAPFALFDHDGNPLHANSLASAIMGPAGTLTHLHASAASALSDAKLKGFAEIPFGVLKIFLKKLSLGSYSVLFASFGQPERAPAAPRAETSKNQEPKNDEEPKDNISVMQQTPAPSDPVGWEVPPVQAASQMLDPDTDKGTAAEEHESSASRAAMAENPSIIPAQENAETEASIASLATASEEDTHEAAKTTVDLEDKTAPESKTEQDEEEEEEEEEAIQETKEVPLPNATDGETREQPYSAKAEADEVMQEAAKQAPVSEEIESAPADQHEAEHAAAAMPAAPQPAVAPTKRAPSRFVWQADAEGRFTNISADLAEGVGAAQAGRVGEDWVTLAARAGITNTDALLAAVKRRDTWSGVSVLWPVEGTETARPVDLAALPVFDRDRNFLGYRGFGVFREAIPFIAKTKPVAVAAETADEEPVSRDDVRETEASAAENNGLPSQTKATRDDEPVQEVETSTPAAPLADEITPALHAAENAEPVSAAEQPSETGDEAETEETAANDEFPLPHEPVEFEALRAAAQAAINETTAAGETSEHAPASEPDAETQTSSLASASENDAAPHEENEDRKALTPKEQVAFREIGRVLLQDTLESDRAGVLRDLDRAMNVQSTRDDNDTDAETQPEQDAEPAPVLAATADLTGVSERALMDRIPLGIAVHRDEKLLYANRALLDWSGYENLEALERAGGLHRVFSTELPEDADPTVSRSLAMRGPNEEPIPVETRLFATPWYGKAALVYVLRRANAGFDEKRENMERSLRAAEAATRDQQAILDTATDGVLIIDRDGKIVGMNKSAEALFSFDFAEVKDASFTMLFAPESHRAAVDYLDKLASNGVASILNDGREVVGRERNGGLIPLFMNLGKVGDDGQKFCAVLRDITQWKRAEEELTSARRQAETASSHKSDFLAKISHEMRTPLNAIIGFAEVMIEERFGPIGSERYRDYLKDIHQSGAHLISLINDLLDLSKIEAGKLELDFTSVDLNDVAKQCISIMQPQANRERIIIRTALAEHLPPVVADLRSIRQIVLNLLSNSVKFTRPGGQVILSTSTTEKGEVVMRVRDTGVGMTEEEVTAALEPFRQLATSGRDTKEGTGLGLPLTKALVEANRASFQIKSTVNSGTLVEIAFPSTRVLAS